MTPTDREVLERLSMFAKLLNQNRADREHTITFGPGTIADYASDLTHILRRYAEMAKALEPFAGVWEACGIPPVSVDRQLELTLLLLGAGDFMEASAASAGVPARTLTEKDETPDV